MVRKFLYVVAFCIVLVIAGGIVLTYWSRELTELALTPQGDFVEQDPLAGNSYEDPAMWLSRPGMGNADPSQWRPASLAADVAPSRAAVFFIHPTSYIGRAHWNAALDDAETNARAAIFLRGQASAFNDSADIWAPRYRQAAFGAFLTDEPQSKLALDLADTAYLLETGRVVLSGASADMRQNDAVRRAYLGE